MKKFSASKIKREGQVFTPDYLVSNMLDYCGYLGNNIIGKHIIDNSCGDGAFLCEIVKRYCNVCVSNGIDKIQIKRDLQNYIHGIELDTIAYKKCIENLNRIVNDFNLTDIAWDIHNEDTLNVDRYNSKMDFVVGNPPYVRVHNLHNNYDNVKKFSFANGGMTDLYLVFFEIGFRMLNKSGRLCYITPSSWLSSKAAYNMRKYIVFNKNIVSLIDLGHYQAFDAISYSLISIFENSLCSNSFKYYVYDGNLKNRIYVDDLTYKDIYINSNFYLSSKEKLVELHKIKCSLSCSYVKVKNGFATLADKVFIGETIPDSPYTIDVLKASTGKWYKCFFPYDKTGKPLPLEMIFSHSAIADYLISHKETLMKSDKRKEDWYLFGRTQAIRDVHVDKIAVNTIIKDKNSIKINFVPAGKGIYSGLYIISDVEFSIVKEIIDNEDFIDYLRVLKNYKSGGYYTFNSRDLEQYINYKLKLYYNGKTEDSISVNKRRVFESNLKLF
jgi:adenine-specific DNA-methyltransferase